MDGLDFFRKLRDVTSSIVDAMEKEDAEALENAMGKFLYLMVQADAIK